MLPAVLVGGLWQSASVAFLAAAQLLVFVVLARYLRPSDFGCVAFANALVSSASLVFHAGIGPTIIHARSVTRGDARAATLLAAALGTAAAGILGLTAPSIALVAAMPGVAGILRLLALVVVVGNLSIVSQALLERSLRFGTLMVVDVTAFVVGYGLTSVTLAAAGWGPFALAWASVGQAVVRLVLFALVGRAELPYGPREIGLPTYVRYGGALTLAQAFNLAALQVDNLVIGKLLGPVTLGLYDRVFLLMTLPGRYIGDVADKVLFPALARLRSTEGAVSSAHLRSVGVAAVLAIPITPVLVILAPELVSVLLGPGWSAAILPFQLLLVALPFRLVGRLFDSLLRATGRVAGNAWVKGLYALAVLAASLAGTRWGLPGVALGVTAAAIAHTIVLGLYTRRTLAVEARLYIEAVRPGVCLGLFMLPVAFALAWLSRYLGLPAVVVLLWVAAASGGAAVVGVWRRPRTFGGMVPSLLSEVRRLVPACSRTTMRSE